MMIWIRRIFLLVCILGTVLLIWAGVYTRKQGFTQSWRNAIELEFEQRGYHVEIGKLTLGAFRGLVAEDVIFFETNKRRNRIAYVDDVFLDVDLSRILQKEVSVNTLDVQDARLSLPLNPANPGEGRLQVTNLSGRVIVTESIIEILSVTATVEGMELRLKGSLVKSNEEDDEEAENQGDLTEEKAWNARRRQLFAVIEAVREIEFLGEAPTVTIEFRGDLADLATTTARIEVEAGDLRRRGESYQVEELAARFRFDGGAKEASLEKMTFRDSRGDASVSASWSGEQGEVEFEAESTVDLGGLLSSFGGDPRLQEIVFFQPPEVNASGTIDLAAWQAGEKGFPGSVIGEFQSARFVTRGRVFSGIELGFSLSGERYYVRNLRLDHKTGVAFLNLKHEPGLGAESVQYQTEVKLDPHVFRPFMDENGRKFLDGWSFNDNSTVYLAAAGRGEDWDLSQWENRGVIDLRNFRLNGVPFLEMEASFESQEGMQWFRDISLVREEGRIDAELAEHRVEEKLWEVKGAHSTVDFVEGARAFSPELARHLGAYRFASPPSIRLDGILDARRVAEVGDEPRRTDLEIRFESDAAAEYDFLGKTLTLEPSSGRILVDRSRVHLTELRAGAFGGRLELEYDARDVRSPRRPFVAHLRVEGIPLEAVTRTYNDSDSVRGKVAGELHLSGSAADLSTLRGRGIARITDGNLFAIPVLGPLSKIIEKASPNREGAGHSIAREAAATATIENGVLRTEDLEAYADSFRVRAAGSVSLVSREVDFEAVVGTKDDLSRAILTPVSELLTFSCTGTISEPEWKAKHISNLGKLPAQVINEMTRLPAEGLKAIGKGLFGERKGAEAVEGGETGGGEGPSAAEGSETGSDEPPRRRLLERFRRANEGISD